MNNATHGTLSGGGPEPLPPGGHLPAGHPVGRLLPLAPIPPVPAHPRVEPPLSLGGIATLGPYRILEALAESPRSVVLRARHPDQGPVILKILNAPISDPAPYERFLHEGKMLRDLAGTPGVIRLLGQETLHNKRVLVLEDFGGIALDRLELPMDLDLAGFLDLAVTLTRTLQDLHEQRLIHRNIAPANVVWNGANGQVALIDFALASRLLTEQMDPDGDSALEGTLACMAPEQSGRMNRSVDHRADLYGLGATFHHLLTGAPPFVATDPQELIHCHLARTPGSLTLRNRDVPELLSDLVLKLLAKDPQDRYQSARGLLADLQRIREQRQGRQLPAFPLGREDFDDHFRVSQKVYGRDRELQVLQQAFDRAQAGGTELLALAGPSGMGKSTLVFEARKGLSGQGTLFLAGKSDQFNRNTPFLALSQAFESLVYRWLGQDAGQLAEIRGRLQRSLGGNAQVIAAVVPHLDRVIGTPEPVPELPPDAARNRFTLAFRNFLQEIARPASPVILFLDDMQWCDRSTLEWIDAILARPAIGNLCVILSCRDDELADNPPLWDFLEQPRDAHINRQSLRLDPLALDPLTLMVADTLRRDARDCLELAALCREKTGGNPFFLNQFLRGAHQRGQIWSREGRWHWDLAGMRDDAVTANMADLLTASLGELTPRDRYVLFMAGCLGSTFAPDRLARACHLPEHRLLPHLETASRAGVIQPNRQRLPGQDGGQITGPSYRFLHDRLRQAALGFVAEPRRRRIHWRIGQRLMASGWQEEEDLFAVTDLLNRGLDPSLPATARLDMARLNFRAGLKARNAAAFEPARHHLETALDLLPPEAWRDQYDLTREIHIHTVEIHYLLGRTQAMDRLAELALGHLTGLLERVRIQEIRILSHIARQQQHQALDIGWKTLPQLGIRLPARATRTRILAEFVRLRLRLLTWPPERLIQLPEMTDPFKLAAMRLMSILVSAAYFANSDLLAILVFRQVELSIRHGNTLVSPMAYNLFGMLLCGVSGELPLGYRFYTLATRLQQRFGANRFQPRSSYIGNVFIRHWREPLAHSLPDLMDGYRRGLDMGDIEYGSYAILTYLEHSWFLGQDLPRVERDMARYGAILRQIRQNQVDYINITHQAVLNLMNLGHGTTELTGPVFDQHNAPPMADSTDRWIFNFTFHFNKLLLTFLFHDHVAAAHHAREAGRYLDSTLSTYDMSLVVYLEVLNHLQLVRKSPLRDRLRLLARQRTVRRRLRGWARLSPVNYAHKDHLLQAETLRSVGRDQAALAHYEQAVRLAGTHGFGLERALALELTALFHLDRDLTELAHFHLEKAFQAYLDCGAVAKARDLESSHPGLLSTLSRPAGAAPGAGEAVNGVQLLDLPGIFKAAHAISDEMDFTRLVQKLVEILLRHAGAQLACLILLHGDRPFLEASGEVDGTTIRMAPVTPMPMDRQPNPPVAPEIVHYVIRTNELLVLDDASRDNPFSATPHLAAGTRKSILCMPLSHRGTVVGAVYLENNLTTASFSQKQVETTRMLAVQAATSLHNAKVIEQRRQTERLLLRSKRQLRELTRHQQLIREHEQKRIAQEIHDELGSILTRIRLELDLLHESGTEETPATVSATEIEGLADLVQQAIHTTRRIATTLRPKILDQCGVLPALEWQARQFNGHFEVRVEPGSRNIRLEEDREITLFRVGQEAITNVARHAGATLVSLALTMDDTDIHLRVADDGRGLPNPFPGTGETMGLRGMRERVNQLGGHLSFSPSSWGGTLVEVRLPRKPGDLFIEEAA
ncbi:MAG: AAA family ATPase [Magnetococcales bacterium]|nr:AAA family ATPase [Magnetococcales bacterium]